MISFKIDFEGKTPEWIKELLKIQKLKDPEAVLDTKLKDGIDDVLGRRIKL